MQLASALHWFLDPRNVDEFEECSLSMNHGKSTRSQHIINGHDMPRRRVRVCCWSESTTRMGRFVREKSCVMSHGIVGNKREANKVVIVGWLLHYE